MVARDGRAWKGRVNKSSYEPDSTEANEGDFPLIPNLRWARVASAWVGLSWVGLGFGLEFRSSLNLVNRGAERRGA